MGQYKLPSPQTGAESCRPAAEMKNRAEPLNRRAYGTRREMLMQGVRAQPYTRGYTYTQAK